MEMLKTDVVVVGAGTAGLSAYRAAKAAGASALLVEGAAYGTTCARVGCMPSKLLIAAARAAHAARESARFGVRIDGSVLIDGREVMARVRGERDRFVDLVVESTERIISDDRLLGHARFVDDNLLEVGGKRVHARSVVIATGSAPKMPTLYRALGDRAIINDDVFAWTDLPRKVAVVGAGVIGLELSQALAWLGVDVTLLGARDRVGPLTDRTVRRYAQWVFSASLRFDPNAEVGAVTREGDTVHMRYRSSAGELVDDTFDYVLVTAGRTPNVDGLAIGNTTMEVDERGLPLFDPETLQARNRPVFIAGDANGVLPLLHEAADEGRTAGINAARFPITERLVSRAPMSVVFTEPGIAMVGARYVDLADSRFVTGKASRGPRAQSYYASKHWPHARLR